MTIGVKGIGWLTKQGYGCVRSGLRQRFEGGDTAHSLTKKGIFSHPFRNFGRLDALSKMTAYAVALALQDAGIEYGPDGKLDIGIVGTNTYGSLIADTAYFRDYVNGGRTLGRGNLFIYTLPSSPLGEAAIHFGIQGPLLYAADGRHSLPAVLDLAGGMVAAGEASMMLAGRAEEDEAVYFTLMNDTGDERQSVCTLSDARSIAGVSPDTAEIVQKFSLLDARKA